MEGFEKKVSKTDITVFITSKTRLDLTIGKID